MSYQQLQPRPVIDTQSSMSLLNNQVAQGQLHPQTIPQTISDSILTQPIMNQNNLTTYPNQSRTDNYSSILGGSTLIEDRVNIQSDKMIQNYNI